MLRGGAVDIKTTKEIELMREVCHLTAETLSCVGEIVRAGITTQDIDDFVQHDTAARGCRAAPLIIADFRRVAAHP